MAAKTKTSAKVKKRPVKAGHSQSKKVGGAANAKATAIAKKVKA